MIEKLLFGSDLLNFMQVGFWGDFLGNIKDKGESLWGSASAVYNETGSAINSFMIDVINNQLFNYGQAFADDFIGVACHLGAIFAICVAAAQAYKVMARGEEFNILAVMRPLIFAFVLTMWMPVCNTLLMPGALVETVMRAEYKGFAEQLHEKREYRQELAWKVNEIVNQKAAEAQKVQKETDSGWWDELVSKGMEMWDGLKNIVANTWKVIQITVMYWFERFCTGVAEIVFSVAVYIIFLTKVLYLTVLMMFGPIFMVCSILDVWKDQWATWVGRMIHVSFYGAMAYLVMAFSCHMITYAIDLDIQKLNVILNDPAQGMAQYLASGFGTTIMTVVGYLAGAIAMSTVHELASLTFPGSPLMGAGSFIQGMGGKTLRMTRANKVIGS